MPSLKGGLGTLWMFFVGDAPARAHFRMTEAKLYMQISRLSSAVRSAKLAFEQYKAIHYTPGMMSSLGLMIESVVGAYEQQGRSDYVNKMVEIVCASYAALCSLWGTHFVNVLYAKPSANATTRALLQYLENREVQALAKDFVVLYGGATPA
jgi:hypothetical protein